MFILSLTYTKSTEEADKFLKGHYDYIEKYVAAGKFILVGRKVPRTGGVIICDFDSREELDRVMQEDPFNKHEIGHCEVTEFVPTRSMKELEVIWK